MAARVCSDQPKKLLKSSGIKGFDPYIEITNYLEEKNKCISEIMSFTLRMVISSEKDGLSPQSILVNHISIAW